MSQGYLKSTGTRSKSLFGFCLSRWLLITGTSAITLKSHSIFIPEKVYLFFWYNTVIYQRVHCVVEMEPYLAQLGIKVNNNDMTVQINVCTCICLDTAQSYISMNFISLTSPVFFSSSAADMRDGCMAIPWSFLVLVVNSSFSNTFKSNSLNPRQKFKIYP